MKILYIHQYFNNPLMIGSTRSYEIAKRLVHRGHEVTIVTSKRDFKSRRIEKEFFEGINIIWLPIKYSNRLGYIERIWSFIRFALISSFESLFIDAEIVIATSTPLSIFFPAFCFSIFKKVPLIFEIRDLWPDVPIALGFIKNKFLIKMLKTLESFIYKFSNVLIVLSPQVKERIKEFNIQSKKIATIPNFSNIDFFKTKNKCQLNPIFEDFKRNDFPVILYTGTFGLVNDISYLIDLGKYLLLIKSNIKIVLLGNGSEREKLIERSIANNTYKHNIFFINEIPKEKIPFLCSYASMMVSTVKDIPELNANSANKFFDSLAAGKPIFINHSGWMKELIEKYGCGYCSWNKSLQDVAKELNFILNKTKILNQMGLKSKKLAKLHFDIDVLTLQFSLLVEKLFDSNFNPEDIAPGIY